MVGRLLHREGARLFAVATGDEAERLMRQLPDGAKVLTLGLVGQAQMARLIAAGMPLTLYSEKQGSAIVQAAAALGQAAEAHVKVDTGLHRLGLDPETAAEIGRGNSFVRPCPDRGAFYPSGHPFGGDGPRADREAAHGPGSAAGIWH
jgi:alanine racemase